MSLNQNSGVAPDAADGASRSTDSSLAPDVNVRAAAAPAAPGAPTPDLARTGEAIDRPRSRSIEATLLTVLAVLYTMYFARGFLIPIVFALLLNFLLSPLIRRMSKHGVKPPVGAGLVVVLLLVGIGWGAYELAAPAQRGISRARSAVGGVRRDAGVLVQ